MNKPEGRLELKINDQIEDFEIKMVHGNRWIEVIDYNIHENIENKRYLN